MAQAAGDAAALAQLDPAGQGEHAVEPGFGPDTRDAMRSGVDGLTFFTSVLTASVLS